MKPFFEIHIPKTGGISRHSILKKYCKDFQRPKTDKIKVGDSLWFGHNDPEETLRFITMEHYKQAIKVCWIRDPRARLVSLYHFYLFKEWVDSNIIFSDFVDMVIKKPLYPIGLYARKELSPCNPQVRWIENVTIDFMGRFENMEFDWKSFCSLIEIPFEPLPHLNKRGQKINWRNYYNDPVLLQDVNRFYIEDLKLGVYKEQI